MDDQSNVEINIKVSKIGDGLGLEEFDKRFVVDGELANIIFFLSGLSQVTGCGTKSILCWPRCPADWARPPGSR